MMTADGRQGFVIPPDGGTSLSLLGYDLTYKVRAQQSEGRLSIVEFQFPAGMDGPPVHTDDHDEVFLVVEGDMRFQIGQQVMAASVGTTVFVPRGISHTFKTEDRSPSRVLTMFTPGGFEDFFEEAHGLFATSTPDRSQLMSLAGLYGTTYTGLAIWNQPPTV